MPSPNIRLVLGTMTFGDEGQEGVRIHNVEVGKQFLEAFKKHGYSDLDTSRIYGGGTTEKYLAATKLLDSSDFAVHTKVYPTKGKSMGKFSENGYSHSGPDVRRSLIESLKTLKVPKVDLFYLHAPDRSTPFEETLREINALYKEGYFNRFGISNFMSWEVAQICEICRKNNWLQPAVYQGIYNALHRAIEPELIPCLRYYGISLYCFQPLAGGFLTSRYKRVMDENDFEPGSRFDPRRWQGSLHRDRYLNDFYFDALDIIRPMAQKHNLTEAECAFRWLRHHSQLADGDAILVGASRLSQLETNIADAEKGSLPEDVVEALDAAWETVKGVVPKYFH
ncbi:NADP-dependent oxidoreductase domain-containing protein [Aspergillus californicus]